METTPKKTKTNTKKTNTIQEDSIETPLVKPLSKKHLSAVETYQALEDNLTPEEKNSKIPLIIAFLSALALIIGLSIFLSQVSNYSGVSWNTTGTRLPNDKIICDDNSVLVCWINGLTYKNACVAESANIIIEHDGECLDPTNEINLSTITGSQSQSVLPVSMNDWTWSLVIDIENLSEDSEVSISTGNIISTLDSNMGDMSHTKIESPEVSTVTNNVKILNINSYRIDPNEKIATYNKREYNYSYSFPAATFFQWFIPPKWVTHEMVLKYSAPPNSRLDGDIVIDFYRWKLLAELQGESLVMIDNRYYIAKGDSTFVIEDLTKTAQSKKIIDIVIPTLNY